MSSKSNQENLSPIEEIKKEYLEKIDYFGNRRSKYALYKKFSKKYTITMTRRIFFIIYFQFFHNFCFCDEISPINITYSSIRSQIIPTPSSFSFYLKFKRFSFLSDQSPKMTDRIEKIIVMTANMIGIIAIPMTSLFAFLASWFL